jgi:hypothetical protein
MMFATVLAEVQRLNAGGLVMMVGCIGLVCGLLGYCLYRVFMLPPTGGE